MAKIKLLPFFLLIFITSDLKSADFVPELKHKLEMDRLKKDSLRLREPLLPKAVIHLPDGDGVLARKAKMNQMRRDSLPQEEVASFKDELAELLGAKDELTSLGKDFKGLVLYVLKAYPSAILGLYHAIKHDIEHGLVNHLHIWELVVLNDLIKLKPHIFEQLIDLSHPDADETLLEEPKDIEKVKRELFAGLLMDLSRDVVVFTPTAWEITRVVLRFAYPTQVLKSVEEGMKYSTCALPIAMAGATVELINNGIQIKRGKRFVLKSFPIIKYILPVELLGEKVVKVNKNHQQQSYLERWVIGAMALIICDLNHVGVLANYAHAGVNLAQMAAISVSVFPGGVLVSTIAGLSLAAVDQGINLQARRSNLEASAHKKAVLSLVGRLLSSNVLVDYLKDLGILQKSLPAQVLRNTMANFSQEKLKVFHQLMAMVVKRYLFP